MVAPPGSNGTTILLARASKPIQEPFIGNQAGGRVFLFWGTDDFWRDYNEMKEIENENTNWGKSVTGVVIYENKVLLARHTYVSGVPKSDNDENSEAIWVDVSDDF